MFRGAVFFRTRCISEGKLTGKRNYTLYGWCGLLNSRLLTSSLCRIVISFNRWPDGQQLFTTQRQRTHQWIDKYPAQCILCTCLGCVKMEQSCIASGTPCNTAAQTVCCRRAVCHEAPGRGSQTPSEHVVSLPFHGWNPAANETTSKIHNKLWMTENCTELLKLLTTWLSLNNNKLQ